MRHPTLVLSLAVGTAFAAGIAVSPVAQRLVSDVHAQTPLAATGAAPATGASAPAAAGATAPPPLSAAMIDLVAIKHGDLPTTSNPEMNTRMLVTTANATMQLQSGNVAKHMHPMTDEIQYIIEGSGAMWLGSERKDFKPGTLIVIPKGVAHGGTIVASGPVKALAIKIPPQPPTDTVFLN